MSKVGADDYIVETQPQPKDFDALPRVEVSRALAPEALYGLPGRVVETIDPYTEADPVATLVHFLVAAGNLIGPAAHARVQHDQHPARLNAVFVGRSGKGRKGTALSTPKHMLAQVDGDWAAACVKSGLSSGEGLIYHVRDPQKRQQEIQDNGHIIGYQEVVDDEGAADRRLLIIEPEFATVLKRMGREGNTLSANMREAWDSGNLSTLTKNTPLRATGAHVSIIAHGTDEEMRRYLTETERANGFANRFLWLHVRRSKVLPEGGAVPDRDLAPLVDEVRAVTRFTKAVGEIRRDEAARELWHAVYPKLSEGESGLIGAIISRAEAQVLRLSLLYALLDRSTMIRPPHLKAALALWDYAEASARRIFGGLLGSSTEDVILKALIARGPLDKTAISALFGRHKRAPEIDGALRHLEETNKVRHHLRVTNGRTADVWEAA